MEAPTSPGALASPSPAAQQTAVPEASASPPHVVRSGVRNVLLSACQQLMTNFNAGWKGGPTKSKSSASSLLTKLIPTTVDSQVTGAYTCPLC